MLVSIKMNRVVLLKTFSPSLLQKAAVVIPMTFLFTNVQM